MQVKLRELFNTRYLYRTFKRDILYVFRKVHELQQDPNTEYFAGSELHEAVFNAAKVGTNLEFDLADIKLSSDMLVSLSHCIEKYNVHLIDTKDAVRNSILRTNRERASMSKENLVTLPEYNLEQSLVDYINSLDPDVLYTLPVNNDIYLPITYLIVCTRPSIKIDFQSLERRFFTFVGSRLPEAILNNYKEFYFNTKEGTTVLDFSNGTADTQYKKNCTISEALMFGHLVPTCFGTAKLHKVEGFDDIFKECLNFLNNYRNTRSVKLSEIL